MLALPVIVEPCAIELVSATVNTVSVANASAVVANDAFGFCVIT
jgi:hypothetical protein